MEVTLKEGDKEPEQHLDEGEHIQRMIVPLNELYDKLQGTHHLTIEACHDQTADVLLALSQEKGTTVDAR